MELVERKFEKVLDFVEGFGIAGKKGENLRK